MNPFLENQQVVTRRQFFGKGVSGLGALALSSLLDQPALGSSSGFPNFSPKAKRVIYLWQGGGPSHVDLFDPKPTLQKMAMQDLPESVRGNTRLSTMTSGNKAWPIIPALKAFQKHGKSGMEISDLLPHTASIADDICLIRSMNTEAVNHAPGVTFFLTGSQIPGRPSLGAWTTYGLGSESSDLPSFVVMTSSDRQKSCGQLFFDYYWGSGFLPSRYQGVRFSGQNDPVPYLSNPQGINAQARRHLLDDIRSINQAHMAEYGDPEIDTRISQYELAYRMQTSVPDLLDFSTEPKHILEMYGPDVLEKGSYAYNCLMARRLIERGVRFVQLMHAGWDQHNNLHTQLAIQCKDTDQASAALVKDLKQRGLLEDTLVIWGGEFGRTPFGQGDPISPKGRDHFGKSFSMWMAGGGVRAGHVHGATDEFAWNIAQDPVHVHDHQATILHLLGMDHTRLTYRYQGRQFRLTDVHGKVVEKILT